MKGLLLKDLYVSRSSILLYGFIFIAFFILSIFSYNVVFVTLSAAFLTMLPATIFSYDAAAHWDTYAGGLPVSRKTQVLEKYVFGLLAFATGGLLMILCVFVNHLRTGEPFLSLFAQNISVLFLCMLTISILLPCMFRFGAEKGRIILFTIMILLGGGIGTVSNFLKPGNFSQSQTVLMFGVIAAISVISLPVSYLISLRIMNKKDL